MVQKLISILFILFIFTFCKKNKELKNQIKPIVGKYNWDYTIVYGYDKVIQGFSSYTIVDTLDTINPSDYKFSYSIEIKKNKDLIFFKDKIKWDNFKIKSFTPYNTIAYGIGNSQDYLYFNNDTLSYSPIKQYDVFIPYFTYNNFGDSVNNNLSISVTHYFVKQ